MDTNDLGRSAEAEGLSQAEPKVSALRASIPSAAEAFHPSEYINEELAARGWDKFDLAVRMGGDAARNVLVLDMYEIVGPKKTNCRLGEETAGQLAVAFDVSAQFFLNLEAQWIAYAQGMETRRAET